jgi:Flp pilus assembly protein TadG
MSANIAPRVSSGMERGAVAALVAMMLGMGVLLGVGALSIDVGSAMWERRQLQNGADAASLALAAACAKDDANCTDTNALIETFNDANAADGSSSNDGVCGRFPSSYVPADISTTCASATDDALAKSAALTNLGECPPLPTWLTGTGDQIPYVEVKTGTSTANSDPTILPAFLSRSFTGGDVQHFAACARAAWGPPGSFSGTLPIAMSTCEFERYTGSSIVNGLPGTAVPPPSGAHPGYGGTGQPSFPDAYSGWPNKVGDELYVMTHSTNGTECTRNGKDTAGGFGWLDSGPTCTTTVTTTNSVDYWAAIDTGNNVPNPCKTVLDSFHGRVLLVPVFDCLVKSGGTPVGPISSIPDCTATGGGGGTTYYHLAGYASFYLSGNKLDNTVGRESVINNTILPCSGSSPVGSQPNPWTGNSGRCLSGWFVSSTLVAPSIATGGAGGGNYGTSAVAPAG